MKSICEVCKKEFNDMPSKHRRFCSRECFRKWMQEQKIVSLKGVLSEYEEAKKHGHKDKLPIIGKKLADMGYTTTDAENLTEALKKAATTKSLK